MSNTKAEGEEREVYSYNEVIEILRHALFGGTPDLYDSGGIHGNHNLVKDHTTKRAKETLSNIHRSKVGKIITEVGKQNNNQYGK